MRDEFISICKKMDKYCEIMNFKKYGAERDKIIEIFKKYEKDIDEAKNFYFPLFTHENRMVEVQAASHCLALGIYIDEAKAVLEKFTSEGGTLGFNVKMTLKVYSSQGYLKLY